MPVFSKGKWKNAKELECAYDDVMEAMCMAVTAAMHAHGMSKMIPSEPEKDRKGLFMQLIVPE